MAIHINSLSLPGLPESLMPDAAADSPVNVVIMRSMSAKRSNERPVHQLQAKVRIVVRTSGLNRVFSNINLTNIVLWLAGKQHLRVV